MESGYQFNTLPTPSVFLTSVIRELSSIVLEPVSTSPSPGVLRAPHNSDSVHNPLSSLSPETLAKVKPILLTLHCLFPNEFLLALDLLDRKLIRKYLRTNASTAQDTTHGTYFVLSSSTRIEKQPTRSSSQAPRSPPGASQQHSGIDLPERYYEIHLHSWNCTCPAFAVASFSSPSQDTPELESSDLKGSGRSYHAGTGDFGGLLARGITGGGSEIDAHLARRYRTNYTSLGGVLSYQIRKTLIFYPRAVAGQCPER
ncbi:hypothetical protein CISG_08419 [Coccidioides immitis RMSCC 3703]|uniref:SWIM-type domain-containing protein n=1 Tax=Coccidioides immitis RMSCC 3703 TaxID=454286 RepID=A0A0J8U171_COCIT|nr:hypothetical protein CISG_08419 [Coccidioides immitis RMSCC 3703]